MNRKKYGIVFEAVAIVLLMVSSATAVTMSQSNESTKSGTTVGSYESRVDPNIYLTKEKVPILIEELQYIDNPEVSALVKEIINTINEKGYVNSNDIKSIENKLGTHLIVGTGFVSAGGSGRAVSVFPGFFLSQIFYAGPSVFVSWEGLSGFNTPTSTRINFRTIDGDQWGCAIGFAGYVGNGIFCGVPYYGLMGVGALIIVVPISGTQQSSPTSI